MNAFLDHYLSSSTAAPVFDVGATVTRCLDHDAPLRYAAAPTWSGLHPRSVTFTSHADGVTNSATPGPAALATDPISTATLPLPGAYKGCRKMAPSSADPTAATYLFPAEEELVLMGGPVVDLDYDTTGPDTELNVRLWDVAPDASVQGLVTRGTYRSLDGPGTGLNARFQIAPQGYRFPAGHSVKLEVAANDAPYFQASNVPAAVRVDAVRLTLPLLEGGASGPTAPATGSVPAPRTAALPASGPTGSAGVALVLVAVALAVRPATRAARPRRVSHR
jgi:predicted acyl esterase